MFSFNLNRLFLLNLLVALILLISLRNLTSFYYLLIGAGIFFFLSKNISGLLIFRQLYMPYYIFLYLTGFVIIWSFFFLASFEPIVGIPRILLMPLLSYIFFNFLDTQKDYKNILFVILICFSLGALSLLYQFLFEPIDWFAQSATRSILTRYSSILGSLTVFGTIAGYFFILIFGPSRLIKNSLLRLIFLFFLLIGVAISLQKTALFTLALAFIILMGYNLRFNFLKIKISHLIFSIFFVLSVPVLIILNPEIQKYVSTLLMISTGIDLSLYSSSVIAINDVGSSTISWDEILRRLYGFFYFIYQEYGNYIWVFGVGLKGGAGVMGMEGISSHNGLLDLLVMGGPLYLISFLYLYFVVQIYFFKNLSKDNLSATFFLLNLLFLIVAVPTAGSLFQPSVSIIFWTSVSYFFKKKLEKMKISNSQY